MEMAQRLGLCATLLVLHTCFTTSLDMHSRVIWFTLPRSRRKCFCINRRVQYKTWNTSKKETSWPGLHCCHSLPRTRPSTRPPWWWTRWPHRPRSFLPPTFSPAVHISGPKRTNCDTPPPFLAVPWPTYDVQQPCSWQWPVSEFWNNIWCFKMAQ